MPDHAVDRPARFSRVCDATWPDPLRRHQSLAACRTRISPSAMRIIQPPIDSRPAAWRRQHSAPARRLRISPNGNQKTAANEYWYSVSSGAGSSSRTFFLGRGPRQESGIAWRKVHRRRTRQAAVRIRPGQAATGESTPPPRGRQRRRAGPLSPRHAGPRRAPCRSSRNACMERPRGT